MARPISQKTTLGVLRTKLGISAASVARKLGLAQVTIEKIEQQRLAITPNVAKKIAYAYGADPGWVLRGDVLGDIAGISGSVWTPETALQLNIHTDGITNLEAKKTKRNLQRRFAELIRNEQSSRFLQVAIDLEAAMGEIEGKHHLPTRQVKQPFRKRRQKVG